MGSNSGERPIHFSKKESEALETLRVRVEKAGGSQKFNEIPLDQKRLGFAKWLKDHRRISG